MQVTGWIIHLAPVGVLFLIAGQILAMDVSCIYVINTVFNFDGHHNICNIQKRKTAILGLTQTVLIKHEHNVQQISKPNNI